MKIFLIILLVGTLFFWKSAFNSLKDFFKITPITAIRILVISWICELLLIII